MRWKRQFLTLEGNGFGILCIQCLRDFESDFLHSSNVNNDDQACDFVVVVFYLFSNVGCTC